MKKALITLIHIIGFYSAMAQARHALIIGINNYYSEKGVIDATRSLVGCVEDGKAIRGLLHTRFGFKNNELKELYNDNATWNNIIINLYSLLDSCKEGDILFIYYSGHGIKLVNSLSGKGGFSQGLVTCDLYSPFPSVIRDNDFKLIFNSFIDKKVMVTFVTDCCYSGGFSMLKEDIYVDHASYKVRKAIDDNRDDLFWNKDFGENDQLIAKKLPFTNVDIVDARQVARPSERTGSKYLQLGASDQLTESYVVRDAFNRPHGLFTKALLEVFRKNTANISCSDIFIKINDLLAAEGLAKQNTTNVADPTRLTGNLLGSSPASFVDTPLFTCTGNRDGIITLNAGYLQGLAAGNKLVSTSNKKVTVIIKNVNENDATASAISTGKIKQGDKFKVTDKYEAIPPLMKIFIPDDNCDSIAVNALIKKFKNYFERNDFVKYPVPGLNVPRFTQPILIKANGKTFTYTDYTFASHETTFFDTAYMQALNLRYIQGGNSSMNIPYYVTDYKALFPHLVFLPVPSYISAALKKELGKDQQFKIVASAAEADYVLLCNYSGDNSFVFTLSNNFTENNFPAGRFQFEEYSIPTNKISFNKEELAQFVGNFHMYVARGLVRAVNGGNLWFNLDTRRN